MEKLRQLLAATTAAVLVLSIISSANFTSHRAFADEHQVTATFGQSSEIELKIDDELEGDAVIGEIKIETEDGDLADGEYDVLFSCTSPELEQTLDESLEVEDGDGEVEGELLLANNSTYHGCEVAIGEELSVALPSFTVQAGERADEDDEERSNSGRGNGDDDDEEDDDRGSSGRNNSERNSRNATSSGDDDDDYEDDREEDRSEAREEQRKFKLDVDDGRVEIEVEMEGISIDDGSYDAVFSCDAPPVDMTFANSFEVEDGEGEFEREFALENGTYYGCELATGGTVIASFGSFTVSKDVDVEQKREERRKTIVSTVNATQVHERHIRASPSSPGNYTQGSDYTLVADGTAEDKQDAMLNATMSVWKSTRGIILLDITDGTINTGNKTYDIAIGYALYSIQSGAMRIVALVVDDSGEVLKLKLRGNAESEQAEFPIDSGDSLELSFEGNSGSGRNNSLGGWELDLAGTIEAS